MRKILVISFIFLYGCSPEIRVFNDSDKEYPVRNYKTYRWAEADEKDWQASPLYYNKLTDKRIKAAVDDLLAKKDYVLSDSAAELSLRYRILVEERSMPMPEPYGYFRSDSRVEPWEHIYRYREGVLILDVTRTKTKDLVWRGWAVAAIEVLLYDVKNTDTIIKTVMSKILLNFPRSTGTLSDTITVHQGPDLKSSDL